MSKGLDSTFDADLTISAGSDDTVTFQTNATSIGSGNLDVTADTIAVNANVSTTGDAILNATASTISGSGTLSADDLTANAVSGVQLHTTVTTVSSKVSGTGNITINETDGLTAINLDAGSGNVNLTTGGAVTDTDSDPDIQATTLTASIGGAFGSGTNAINTSVTNLAVNSSTANGSQWIDELDSLSSLNLNAGSGNVNLTTGGSVTDTDMDTDVVATTLNAVIDGAFGSGTNAIDTSVTNLNVDTSGTDGSQWISELDSLSSLDLDAGSGSVNLSAGGSVSDTDGSTDIAATSLVLLAGGAVGAVANPIQTSVSNLEGDASGGGFYVDNTGDLTIGGISSTVGIGSSDTIVLRNAGAVDVTENVNATVDIEIVSLSLAGAQPITVRPGVTVSAGHDVILRSSDDLNLQDSSTVQAGNQIHLFGDFGDTDSEGSIIDLFGTLDALGTSGNITVNGGPNADVITVNPGVTHTADGMSLDGGDGNDTYEVFYGRLNGGLGAVAINDTGTTNSDSDRATLQGTANDETFELDGQVGQQGGFVNNVTESEQVTYSSSLEFLTLNGNGSSNGDIFTGSTTVGDPAAGVEPSFSTTITLDGGAPGFGAGTGDVPQVTGDQLILNPLGNVLEIIGKTIFVDGNGDKQVVSENPPNANTGDYQGINFRNIESLPLLPLGTDTQRFDFDGTALDTQAGYTSVADGRVYGGGTAGSDFGWLTAPDGSFDRGNVLTSSYENLLQDGHFGTTAKTFQADVADGWYLVSVKIGDTNTTRDQIRIANQDNGQILLDNLTAPAGSFLAETFVVQVTDGTLDLTISDQGGDPYWVLNGLELRPAELLTIGSPATGPLEANGVEQTTLPIYNVAAGALVTVTGMLDSDGDPDEFPDQTIDILSADADPDVAGIQVQADGNGVAMFTFRHPAGRGTGFFKFEDVSGDQTGCLAVEFTAPAVRRFDFNTPTSPTQAPVASDAVTDGYVGVTPTDQFDLGTGFGWLTAPAGSFDRGPQTGAQAELREDGNFGSSASTFRTELQAGETYIVNVTIGDASNSHDNIQVKANGATVLADVDTAAGEFFTGSFSVAIGASGLLNLEFSDNGGDQFWVLNGLEIRRADQVQTITFAGPGSVSADGTMVDTITGTATGVADGTLVTVTSSLGTVLTSQDASAEYQGVQVLVSSGQFTFDIQRPTGGGVPTLTATTVDGTAQGSVTNAAVLEYVGLPTVRFDFNAAGSPTQTPTQPPTAGGYIGVLPTDLFDPEAGYGWLTAPDGSFNRGPQTGVQAELREDGHFASGARTFEVALPDGSYFVNVTLGDANSAHDNMQVDAEGITELADVDTAAGEFFHDGFVVNVSDGFLSLTISDNGGDPNWVLNGLEVRPAPLGGVSFTTMLGDKDADGTTVDTISGTSTAADGTLLTITADPSLGTFVSSDASAAYQGFQVVVSGGAFSFMVQRPTTAGTPTYRAEAVDGSAEGESNTVVTYVTAKPLCSTSIAAVRPPRPVTRASCPRTRTRRRSATDGRRSPTQASTAARNRARTFRTCSGTGFTAPRGPADNAPSEPICPQARTKSP